MSLELPRIVSLDVSATSFMLTWEPPKGMSARLVSHYKIGYGQHDISTHEHRVPVVRDKRTHYTFRASQLRAPSHTILFHCIYYHSI